jgi:hypothetical protein
MGSVVGAITGSTGAAKRAASAQREAGDMAQYKPWNVTGSYFGDANFDYQKNTASYKLSPELEQLRDMFMNQALAGPDQAGIDRATGIRDKGLSMFNEAYDRDISKDASKYYTDMQDLMAPGRAKTEQRLANNLFASGRMGQGSATFEGGGYANPERLEYLTAMSREDNKMAFDAQSQARSERLKDMQTGLGYYGMGNDMRLDPYNDVYKLFGMGTGVEEIGQNPFKMGMGLGSAAQPGDQARAGAYMGAAQTRLNADQANIGTFTNLIGQGASWAGGGGFSSMMGGGSTAGGGWGSGSMGGMQGGGWSTPIKSASSIFGK